MRFTTKRKMWGRNQLVVALRGIIEDLKHADLALQSGNKEELVKNLGSAILQAHNAGEGMDIYKVERKRIKASLERVQKELAAIMEVAKAIPITQEEKVAAKVARKREKS